MKLIRAVFIVLVALSISNLAFAATQNFTPGNKEGAAKVTSTAAKEKGPGMKAERGVINILFGWTEIPKSIIQVTRDSKNPFWGLTGGTIKGVGKAFPRTISGISDVVSFPVASYNKSPVNEGELKTQIK